MAAGLLTGPTPAAGVTAARRRPAGESVALSVTFLGGSQFFIYFFYKCICLLLQITEKIERFFQDKLQSYKIEVAKDAARAEMLMSNFETSIHTPAVVHV